jgi:hypothetical protein
MIAHARNEADDDDAFGDAANRCAALDFGVAKKNTPRE